MHPNLLSYQNFSFRKSHNLRWYFPTTVSSDYQSPADIEKKTWHYNDRNKNEWGTAALPDDTVTSLHYRLRANDIVVFFVYVSFKIITVVKRQWAYRAREVYCSRSPGTARVKVHAIDVLLQTVGVQVNVIAERTPDVRVGVQFPTFGRRTDAWRWARGGVDVSFRYMVGEFVFCQKRFAAYLAHRLRSQRHFSADAIRLENENATKGKTGQRTVWTEEEFPLTFIVVVVVVSSSLSKSKTIDEIRMERKYVWKNKAEKLILDSSFLFFVCVMRI